MSNNITLRSLLSKSTLPPNEAKILLGLVLEKHYQLSRSALLSRDEMALSPEALQEWRSLETRRLAGEPIAYLIGKKGFHAIELFVTPGVLIPRPETEILVDLALQEINARNQALRVLDLGTGSGAIALAIAHASPQALVTATDQSLDALNIAQLNAKQLALSERVHFYAGSWYNALPGQTPFDLILSNPPYIAAQDPHLHQGDLRFEPGTALTDNSHGLSCLEAIITGANQHLNFNGLIAVEHGHDQSDAVVKFMQLAKLGNIQVHYDLAGHRRVVSARKLDIS